MPFEVRETVPDPTLDVMVNEAANAVPRRLLVLSGTATVAPVQAGGIQVVVRGAAPTPEPIGFYVTGCDPLPPSGNESIWAEVALAQMTVVAYESHEQLYGVGNIDARLVPDPNQGGVRWPYLGFNCFGDRLLNVRYRVTIFGGDDPRLSKFFR